MPFIWGSRFRDNYDNIQHLESSFKEEIIRINEELKQLNLEKDRFRKELSSGIEGLLNRRKTKVLKKKDLISKYNLTHFFKQLNDDERLLKVFETYSFNENIDKIDTREINDLYTLIEDRLYAAMCFVEIIAKYKESNFETNELYQKRDSGSGFAFDHILLSSTEELFLYINNPEIKALGMKMYNKYIEQKEESEKINETITELKSSIKDKISLSTEKSLSLEQLRRYKDLLKDTNELLSQQDEISNNNKQQK